MHPLSILKVLNARAVSAGRTGHAGCAAHTGHAGSGGIQNHSCGPHYPIRSYQIGDVNRDGCHVAEFCGVRRDSSDYAGHEADLDLLKLSERIADAVYAGRADCAGGSYWIGLDDEPGCGYCVSLRGWEARYDSLDGAYNAVYADIVEKVSWITDNGWGGDSGKDVCVGWWHHDGRVYVDVSVRIADYDDAVDLAYCEGQIALWDLAEGAEINTNDALADRNG